MLFKITSRSTFSDNPCCCKRPMYVVHKMLILKHLNKNKIIKYFGRSVNILFNNYQFFLPIRQKDTRFLVYTQYYFFCNSKYSIISYIKSAASKVEEKGSKFSTVTVTLLKITHP
ncbi:hypothetical protein KIL84_019917 [Mauremys mutica]|uniref:Uncharacterized protein n=1 Tax=Mauremys mutica TaxID=74926 RepID=A0A9D4BAG2_9SAUR|nr:hypothetical protein KIL84_019917 [Mauremys mutica]